MGTTDNDFGESGSAKTYRPRRLSAMRNVRMAAMTTTTTTTTQRGLMVVVVEEKDEQEEVVVLAAAMIATPVGYSVSG